MRLAQVLIGGLLTAVPLLGLASPAVAQSNADKIKIIEAVKKKPPIEFFVAKGRPDACGPGCDSWIAAEGGIDTDAAARLRRFLEKIGTRKLPIYFHSTGGDLAAAMAIGRMLRARGMTAGVARTLPAGCLSAKTLDECTKLIRAQPDSEAALRTDHASCVSACALAIFGARTREIAPDALLGVHSTFIYFAHPPRGATARQFERAEEKGMQRLARTFSSYIAEMGMDKELFKIIWSTKFEDMHYLTRAELFDLGIDRRESVETGWHFGYQPIPAVGNAAFANLKIKGDGAVAKRIALIVSCNSRGPGSFVFTALQQIPNASTRPIADLRVSVGGVGVTLTSANSFLTSYKNDTFEVRQQGVILGMIATLLRAPAVTVAEQAPADKNRLTVVSTASTEEYSIPGTGAVEVLRTLVDYCTPVK
jgi:hypothetical protein